jgi:hypothetical protein
MGYYINHINGRELPAIGKASKLISEGAVRVGTPTEFQENLVCVVEGFFFDAAAYAYNEREMTEFNDPNDYRPKTWLIVPNADTLSGFNQN